MIDGLRRFVREDVAPAFAPWVASRAIVVVGILLARDLLDHLRADPRPVAAAQGLFAWDAAYYRDVAQGGYDAVAHAGLRFFPLLPLIARAVAAPIGGRVGPVIIVIVWLAALAYGALLHRFVLGETGDRGLARRSVWIGFLAPPALCLVLGYAEALLAVAAVGAFLAARRGHWWWAAAAAYAAALARPTGVLLALPLAVEAFLALRRGSTEGRSILGMATAVVAPALGLLTFLGWSSAAGNGFLEPLRIQSSARLRGGTVPPWTSLHGALDALGSGDRLGSGLHLVWAIVVIVCVVAAARRLPVSCTVWAAASVLVALCAPNLDSFERYALVTFPVVVGAGVLTARPRDLFPAVTALAGAGLLGATVLAAIGRLVP